MSSAAQDLEPHDIAKIFPLIKGAEFDELCSDIETNGLREAIWLYEGKILDGRNRYEACQHIGILCPARPYTGDDPVGFVLSLNLHRRHLNESQRGMVAANIANLERGGDGSNQHSKTANLQNSGTSRAEAAEKLNVSERTVNTAKKVQNEGAPELVDKVNEGAVSVSAAADVATLPVEEQQDIVAKGEKEILAAAKDIRSKKTETRRKERAEKINEISKGNESIAELDRTFPLIYADPPWRYEHTESESRAIENQYPTMSLDEICEIEIDKIASTDCVLFMWTTSPKLLESFQVLDSWGFEYRTCAIWDKQKIGMGYYFRQQHELLLVACKGSVPVPPPAARVSSVFSYERGNHSSKPLEIYELINAMYPELDKLEMFCRTPQPGWAVWGNQSNAA